MTDVTETADAAPTPTDERLLELEQHRSALTGYCYRMLGSGSEAEDAVQETMVRAWRSIDRFEGRSSVKSWMHAIATNVCFDMLNGRQRRARPVDLGPAATVEAVAGAPLPERPEAAWLAPAPDSRILPDGDPAGMAEGRESIRLAFVAALQHLPARQRAVLILREVLRWRAAEVAELLETTEVSVNSALQRARATLATLDLSSGEAFDELDPDQQALLSRYVDAFERYDMGALASLLHEDATMSMPPYDMWFAGRDEFIAWMAGPGEGCAGSKLVPTVANGAPAFGQYRVDPDGGHAPWALQVLDIRDGRLAAMCAFLDTPHLFPLFGLPDHLD